MSKFTNFPFPCYTSTETLSYILNGNDNKYIHRSDEMDLVIDPMLNNMFKYIGDKKNFIFI